jgi:type IV pilus assembly protein PilB
MLDHNKVLSACVEQGLFSQEHLAKFQVIARRERKNIMRCIAFSVRMPISSFYQAYADTHDYPFYRPQDLKPDLEALQRIPRRLLNRRPMLPLLMDKADDDVVHLVIDDPDNKNSIEQVQKTLGKACRVYMTDLNALTPILTQSLMQLSGESEGGLIFEPVAELDLIIEQAYLCRSSDIHIQPSQDSVLVRLRVDGILQDHSVRYSLSQGLGLMSRLKVLSGMDIAEQRMAQDGNVTYLVNEDIEIDLRVATMPTRFGERATLRLLGSDLEALTLPQIGMSVSDLEKFQQAILKPHGMILITGPTGSGKSTTLYSALKHISDDQTNILTVEDPVEYVMDGISQVQVSNKVSFSDALRAFLRHDPDVIMVGEIRDGETANTTMKAAMTGHLVFSTLHTNSSVAAISRLRDLGAESYLIGATLLAVISQRLVKRLCDNCKVRRSATLSEINQLSLSPDTVLYKAQGCAHCGGTGYTGRIALFETLWVDKKMSALISQDSDEVTLKENSPGHTSLGEDAMAKLLQGKTTTDELTRLALLNADNSIDANETKKYSA